MYNNRRLVVNAKKPFYVLFFALFLIVLCLGYAYGAGEEKLKIMVSNVVTKSEQFPVGANEETGLTYIVRDGVFTLENGELGSFKAVVSSQWIKDKPGTYLGYSVFVFGDGSTIVGTFREGSFWRDPEGKVQGLQKSSGEITSGSGRFKGISGTMTMTGKLLKPVKGENVPKAYNEFSLNYTLSPK